MKKSLLCLMVIVAAAVIPASAADNGFYLGASIGGSSIDVSDFDEELGDLDFSDGDFAYKLFAGYRLMSFFGVEGGYVDLGSPSDTVGDMNDINVKIGVTGWDAFAVGFLPIGPVDIFAKVGLISWDADIRAAFNDLVEHDSDSGNDAVWGVGVAFRLGSFGVRAEGERFDIGNADKVYMFSVGGTFTF
jgi:hypothetical protein